VSPDACYPLTAAEIADLGVAGYGNPPQGGFPVESELENHTNFKRVPQFWSNTTSVATILADLMNYIPQLEKDNYTLFNSIATTDYGKYWSDYNYWEVKDAELALVLANMISVYKSSISAEEITQLAVLIQNCDTGAIVFEISTKDIDVNNRDGWKLNTQLFAATCSKESENNQIFTWAGSKQGEYLPGQYSEANAETVAKTIKAWLFSHIPLLVSCTKSPVQPMHIWSDNESSVNSPFTSSKTTSETSSTNSCGPK
jgi:hypothetical protein